MTDLTEQRKKGELPEGWYWVEDDDGKTIIAEYSAYCIDRETNEVEYDWSCCCEPEQVLAEVPSYEVWKAVHEQRNVLFVENTKLKELLKECREVIKNVDTYYGNYDSTKGYWVINKIDEVLK